MEKAVLTAIRTVQKTKQSKTNEMNGVRALYLRSIEVAPDDVNEEKYERCTAYRLFAQLAPIEQMIASPKKKKQSRDKTFNVTHIIHD